ncbi:MAG: beta-mannosidase, partial [Chitinophagaceae bacterium]|nr:beta-mannosidase [Chitinophagaceae bacterium]
MRYITKYTILFSVFILTSIICYAQRSDFVTTKGHHFLSGKNSYNYIGANYWYGGLLANTTDGKKRVKTELDFLKNKGITNLRIMAGAEGTGLINGMHRVE